MPLIATKLTQCRFAKVSPLLRLSADRYAQIISMNRHIITTILIILYFTSCKVKDQDNSIEKFLSSSIRTNENNIPLDSNQFYFPVYLFRDTSVRINNDTFTVAWYSKHLRAMKEPLLFNKNENKEIFRFTWLRTFDNPIMIRIERFDDKCKLIWKLCDGAGGYEPGNMTIFEEKVITEKIWSHFVHLINKAHFWEMETVEKEPTGLDGEQWILEGRDEKRYHIVDRWSPKSGDFFSCCNFLINEIELDSSKLVTVKIKVDSTIMTPYGLVYILADEYPQFGEYESDLSTFVSNNLKPYLPLIKDIINKKVFAKVVVFEDGSIQDIEILKGIRPDIDCSCINFLKHMPKWKPGKVKGKTIKTQIIIPIRI